MATQHFVPEVWAARLLTALRTAHVYAALCNRDYEGEIASAGDTVRITSISDPEIKDYVPGVTQIVPEPLSTSQRALTIDQAKMFSFEVDDVDRRQELGGIMDEGMSRASYRLRDKVDLFAAARMTAGVQAANILNGSGSGVGIHPHRTAATTGDPAAEQMDAYEGLAQLDNRLTESDVPGEGRWAVIPAWYHLALRLDERFTDLSQSPGSSIVPEGSDTGRAQGPVGRVGGLEVYVSNNVPVASGAHQVVAGTNAATTFAEQIVAVEAFRPESSFSDAVKGLHVYGAKVIRPEHLAVLRAKRGVITP